MSALCKSGSGYESTMRLGLRFLHRSLGIVEPQMQGSLGLAQERRVGVVLRAWELEKPQSE